MPMSFILVFYVVLQHLLNERWHNDVPYCAFVSIGAGTGESGRAVASWTDSGKYYIFSTKITFLRQILQILRKIVAQNTFNGLIKRT